MLMQAITVPDRYYDACRREVDFIKRYIFPGSCIPSVGRLVSAAARRSGLKLIAADDLTADYAETLRRWRASFSGHIEQVRALGYPDRFCRMWEFYLCYCEGGFAERFLGDVQLLWEKWPRLLIGWAAVAVLMALLWARQTRTRNATSVDAAWALSLGVLAIWLAWRTDGEPARRVLVAVIASVWAFRLAGLLYFSRVRGESTEDGRYKAMREHWGESAQPMFFLFYQGQALVASGFACFFLLAMQRAGPLDAWDALGAVLAAGAVSGETIADRQLARWRADESNRGRTCRAGLWRYSRHPNYFFEWIHWWAYVAVSLDVRALIGPALMLAFLFRLTGIPYTERQALKSRGDDYRRYQRTTSVFVPWFPREDKA